MSAVAETLDTSFTDLPAPIVFTDSAAAKVADLTSRIQAQEQWLAQARAGLDEFGG